MHVRIILVKPFDRANLLEDEMTSRKIAGLVDLQNEYDIRSSAPCNNEEKGSTFLVQDMETDIVEVNVDYNGAGNRNKAAQKKRKKVLAYAALFTPKFRVRSATFENMISKNAENASFNMTMNTELGVNNANFGPYKYRNSTVYFYFNGVSIGEAFVSQGKTRFKSTKKFNLLVNLSTKDLLAKDSQLRNDLSSGTLILTSKSKLEGKVELMEI
ncbi:hypothetical protein RND71_030211 [Anisodus tanguticus]|uniref:Uncharacterized protein n=1 Tax=Anisodus tanguticus TaxID=243964 RepID=A0AAE1RH36_9SOLA|nr:hypothetical protein RND71_030211 [Anisodus tanguticus]